MATAGIISEAGILADRPIATPRTAESNLDTRISGLLVLGAIFIVLGVIWDISWHISIGRDTFWTPAHLLIHLGGSMGGFLSGFICLDATFFRRRRWVDKVIQVWGFRAPLGAWVCIWGAGAMLTSAPFDNWWHNTYGLDVKILSPPHMVLALGMHGVVTGAFLLASAARNRATEIGRSSPATWFALSAQGVQMTFAAILISELTAPNLQRTAGFAIATSIVFPAILTAAVATHPFRWAATRVSLIYMGLTLFMMWLLPLFHAEPKLAPVNNRVDHMVPSAFPLLVVIPAFVIDLSLGWLKSRNRWPWNLLLILLSATFFLGIFLLVQWHFSTFMISTAADNWFFSGHGRFMGFHDNREWQDKRWNRFGELTTALVFRAWLVAVASATFGCLLGRFASRVRR